MEVSRKVMRRAAELLDAGVSFALCTVTGARGSVPGKAGAEIIVLADGSPFGTQALYQAAARCPGDIRASCSRLKRKEMFARLPERGVREDDPARFEAPLGLALGPETPAGIAVSIFGSIIQHQKRARVSSST